MHKKVVQLLANGFPSLDWPNLMCPSCDIGVLIPNLQEFMRPHSVNAGSIEDEDFAPEDEFGGFSGPLYCNEDGCGEVIIVTGEWETGEAPPKTKFEQAFYATLLYPKFFVPHLKVLEHFPKGLPENIIKLIRTAEKVVWADPNSAGNIYRKIVEVILDDQNVPQSEITKKGENPLTTHARINLYRESKLEIAELLEAVKWVGNEGSHSSELTVEDIVDSGKILIAILTVLYLDNVKKQARTINANKGIKKKSSADLTGK